MSFQRRRRVAFVRIDRFAKIASSPGLRCIAGENFQTTERNYLLSLEWRGDRSISCDRSADAEQDIISVESTKAATATETTQVSCRHTVTVTASDFHFARDWTLDRPGSCKIFYDSPVDMYVYVLPKNKTKTCTAMCTEYGVRCLLVQTSWSHKRAEFLASELTSIR